jgi:hypothetical protein
MKHSSTRELFEYWNVRRGQRPAPDRSDIEPGSIRRVLADTFILTFDGQKGHPFRIAGTRICAAFGRELKGEAFLDLWSPPSRKLVGDLLDIVTHEVIGTVAGVSCTNDEGTPLDLELLILPLRHRLPTDGRLLGTLAPTHVPYWLGTAKLGGLNLGTLRYVGAELPAALATQIAPPRQNGRIRHGLTVYDGGQA